MKMPGGILNFARRRQGPQKLRPCTTFIRCLGLFCGQHKRPSTVFLTLYNASGGSLSEAVVINFAIIKGVSS